MEAKKIIAALGGCQKFANILNDNGLPMHTRQRVWNWSNANKFPSWVQLEYAKILRKGEKLSNLK